MMAKKKTIRKRLTTQQFAEKANVTQETVQGYCRSVNGGDRKVLSDLRRLYGLISVERYSNKWILHVEIVTA